MILNGMILLVFAGAFTGLLLPAVRNARQWRATVTPLASIIGSGFLVSAPLLASIAGPYAALLMALLCAAGYSIGAAVRHNIKNVEPALKDNSAPGLVVSFEKVSEFCLVIAYVISICFYLQLLSAFALKGAGMDSDFYGKILTTLIISGLGIIGFTKGFGRLEDLEELSVGLKLAVIAALILGLVIYNATLLEEGSFELAPAPADLDFHAVRVTLGALLIVQGFETSRYLGHIYDEEERVSSMRSAQLISAAIYIVFILLAAVFLDPTVPPSETAIIDYSGQIATVLPVLLVIGAIAAQFSAGIADLVGSAGILVDNIRSLSDRSLYPVIAMFVIALTWSTNVFEILTLASRTFAAYYLLQCVIALLTFRNGVGNRPSALQATVFSFGAVISAATLVLGISAH
jgi:hypothetical protein